MKQYKIFYYPSIPEHCQIGYIHNRLELKSVEKENADIYFRSHEKNIKVSKLSHVKLDDKYCINGNLFDTSSGYIKKRVEKIFGFTYDEAEGSKIRIPVIFGEIPFVITEIMGRVVFVDVDEVFDPIWLDNFKLFIKNYLDYGDVTVVDRYIVAINPTPSDTIFRTVSGKQKAMMIKTYSKLFLNGIRDNLWRSQSEDQE